MRNQRRWVCDRIKGCNEVKGARRVPTYMQTWPSLELCRKNCDSVIPTLARLLPDYGIREMSQTNKVASQQETEAYRRLAKQAVRVIPEIFPYIELAKQAKAQVTDANRLPFYAALYIKRDEFSRRYEPRFVYKLFDQVASRRDLIQGEKFLEKNNEVEEDEKMRLEQQHRAHLIPKLTSLNRDSPWSVNLFTKVRLDEGDDRKFALSAVDGLASLVSNQMTPECQSILSKNTSTPSERFDPSETSDKMDWAQKKFNIPYHCLYPIVSDLKHRQDLRVNFRELYEGDPYENETDDEDGRSGIMWRDSYINSINPDPLTRSLSIDAEIHDAR